MTDDIEEIRHYLRLWGGAAEPGGEGPDVGDQLGRRLNDEVDA
jgi:hypothetical protein